MYCYLKNTWLLAIVFLLPVVVFAAEAEAVALAKEFLAKINSAILFPLIALMIAVALLIFLYGAFEYVRGAADSGARETGRKHLMYGIIGLLIMLSAMAILTIAAATFGLDTELNNSQSNSYGQPQNTRNGFTTFTFSMWGDGEQRSGAMNLESRN